MLITISGESCSGKTTFAMMLAKKIKAEVISVDKVIAKLYENEKFCKKLVDAFGEKICEDGKVKKCLVGLIVFKNKKNQKILTKISTPFIEKEIDELMMMKKNVIIEYKFAPLLKFFGKADFNVLLVAENEEKRKELIFKRDNLPKDYLIERDENGVDYAKFNFNFTNFHDYDNMEDFVEYVATKICD